MDAMSADVVRPRELETLVNKKRSVKWSRFNED